MSPVANGAFILFVTSTQTPIGPWLLFESSEEIKTKMFRGAVSPTTKWGHAGIHMLLSDRQLRTLAERARGWLWNGYELIQMRKAGKYPPQRLAPRTTTLVELRRELAVSTSDPKFP